MKTVSIRYTDNSCSSKNSKHTLKFISTHTRRAVSQAFFLHGDSVIKFFENSQQGDFESTALFLDSIADLIDSLKPKQLYGTSMMQI